MGQSLLVTINEIKLPNCTDLPNASECEGYASARRVHIVLPGYV